MHRNSSTSTTPHGTLKRVAPGLYRYTSSKTYFAHLRIGGKLFRASLDTSDRKTAETALVRFKESKRRLDPDRARTSLGALCDRFGDTLGHLARKTRGAKVALLGSIRSELGEVTFVSRIKPSDCDRWLSRQAERIGRSYFNASLAVLRDLFDFAVRDGIIGSNPAAHRKYLRREKPLRLTASWEEFRRVVADIRAQPFNADAEASAAFVEFLGLAGLGCAEAAALSWKDVDFERGRIITFRHKTRTGFAVPMFPQVRPLLETLHARGPSGPNDRVFRISNAKKAIAGACRRLRLPAYTHLSFRRMFITRAIEKGVDVKVIAEWQAHRDGGKLILDTYSHVRSSHSQRMAELLRADEMPSNVVPLPASA